MHQVRFSLLLILILAFYGAQTVKAENSEALAEVKGFENWKPLVKELPVSFRMVALCSRPGFVNLPSESIGMHADSADGTLKNATNKKISVYANDSAFTHIKDAEAGEFPVGSIIVKEKLRDAAGHEENSLGIMIKQKKGFDPANADWEFLFVDESRNVFRGTKDLNNCYVCHRGGDSFGQKAQDLVFVTTYKKLEKE